MTYLLDREFPFGLENLLLCGKNIEEKGLQIIAQIEAKHIVHGSDELKKLFEIIESKCINKRMWVLLGSVDSKKNGCRYNWQVFLLKKVILEER